MKIKNSLSGKIEEFKPIKNGQVSMYSCGPTVYARQHIGNMRPYVFVDLMRRLFEYQNFNVNQVINITDVGHLTSDADSGEDKMEKAIKQAGQSAKEIAENYTNLFFEDLKKLNVEIEKIKFPRATEYITEQIELVKKLEEKGFTYQISDGIYFDTSKFEGYGILGNVKVEQMKAGARVEENKEKRNHTDFALWKFSPKNEKRAQEWESPWGIGFPGWHLECSVMSTSLLGQPFDIHTGGIDHLQIHHNNEIAQSEAAEGKKLANYWIHVNFLIINNEKISKSLGHSLSIDDLEEKNITPEGYRYWLLTSHYSTLINFTEEAVLGAQSALEKLINNFKEVSVGKINDDWKNKILDKLNNDFDSAGAIAEIWNLTKSDIEEEGKLATILEIDKILGIGIENLINTEIEIPEKVLRLAKERQNARENKDFEKADKLRKDIENLGFEVMDTEKGFDLKPL